MSSPSRTQLHSLFIRHLYNPSIRSSLCTNNILSNLYIPSTGLSLSISRLCSPSVAILIR